MNNEDMSELLNKFKTMINEGSIPDEMKNIMSSLSKNDAQDSTINTDNSTSTIDLETIIKMKSILEKMNNKNDPRANLLLSLKPYLKNSRKEKVDQYIKLFGMSKVIEIMNNNEKSFKNNSQKK